MGGWPPAGYAFVGMIVIWIPVGIFGARWLNAVSNADDVSRNGQAIGDPSIDLSSENGNAEFQHRLTLLRGAVLLMLPMIILVPVIVHIIWK